jgi:hypothetical protein
MIPNVFVSSTIEDLQHLREAVRDVIAELGYVPVMSEYGGIGYLPTSSAQDSCYLEVGNCQMAVVIVGKKYGALTSNGVSVTQNEYRTARDRKIPIFCVIDQEVLTYKKVYDGQNADRKPSFTDMDDPARTFLFVDEITKSPVNNAYLAYASVADVRDKLKTQIAHHVGEMLKLKIDPLKSGLDDVLSEVKTLRHELGQDRSAKPSNDFLRAIRFLLDDDNKHYKDLLEELYDTADAAVPHLIASNTFEELITKAGWKFQIVEDAIDPERPFANLDSKDAIEKGEMFRHFWGYGPGQRAYFAVYRDHHLDMNQYAAFYFEELHKRLRKYL